MGLLVANRGSVFPALLSYTEQAWFFFKKHGEKRQPKHVRVNIVKGCGHTTRI
jgi:hypothetical protein